MSAKPTRLPCRANCSTRARPIPSAPPVTKTLRSTRDGYEAKRPEDAGVGIGVGAMSPDLSGLMSPARVALFRAQGDERADADRSPDRRQRGDGADRGEEHGGSGERDRIVRAEAGDEEEPQR